MSSTERTRTNIYGWSSESELAQEVYSSLFRNLLEGVLVFAYRNLGSGGTVKWLVITKTEKGFRFGFIPQGSGFTCYYPLTTYDYIKEVLLGDLKQNKTEKFILEDFNYYIDYYGKN